MCSNWFWFKFSVFQMISPISLWKQLLYFRTSNFKREPIWTHRKGSNRRSTNTYRFRGWTRDSPRVQFGGFCFYTFFEYFRAPAKLALKSDVSRRGPSVSDGILASQKPPLRIPWYLVMFRLQTRAPGVAAISKPPRKRKKKGCLS